LEVKLRSSVDQPPPSIIEKHLSPPSGHQPKKNLLEGAQDNLGFGSIRMPERHPIPAVEQETYPHFKPDRTRHPSWRPRRRRRLFERPAAERTATHIWQWIAHIRQHGRRSSGCWPKSL